MQVSTLIDKLPSRSSVKWPKLLLLFLNKISNASLIGGNILAVRDVVQELCRDSHKSRLVQSGPSLSFFWVRARWESSLI